MTPEEKQKLVAQIAAEAEELRNIPKVPLAKFMGGPVQRCQMCGRLVPINDLAETENMHGRKACGECRRNG